MSVSSSDVVSAFTNQVKQKYDLGEEFITEISKMMTGVLTPYHIYSAPQVAAKAPRTRKPKASAAAAAGADAGAAVAAADAKVKKPRKASAYNIYVKEKMQEATVKAVPQKEKMGMIGKMWAALSTEQKQPYNVLAEAQNATVDVPVVAAAAAATPAAK
jgi:hypothetical protein